MMRKVWFIIFFPVSLLFFSLISLGGIEVYNPTTLVIPPFEHTLGFHKLTTFHLQRILGSRAFFADPQGIVCVKLRASDDPQKEEDDDELTVYGINSGRHQIIYNPSLRSLKTFGRKGEGKGEFCFPRGITADEEGNVYVADSGNHRVVQLRNEKGNLRFVREIGKGILNFPHQVALDSRGRLYVTDTENHRLCLFDSSGAFLKTLGNPGIFFHPEGIGVIDPGEVWSYYHEGAIFVADSSRTRLQKLSLNGELLAKVEGKDFGREEANFSYLAIDYYGNLYATDTANHQIHKFDRNLKYLISFGRKGGGDGEFESPRGITIYRRFGQVFVAEEQGVQYYWIGVDGFLRGAFPSQFVVQKPGTTIVLFLTEPADIEMVIYNSKGEKVRDLLDQFRQTSGEIDIVWNGLNDYGEVVSPDEYTIEVTLEPTYSSKGCLKKRLETKVYCLDSYCIAPK